MLDLYSEQLIFFTSVNTTVIYQFFFWHFLNLTLNLNYAIDILIIDQFRQFSLKRITKSYSLCFVF